MLSVFLDANVLFAASYAPGGRMLLIVDLAALGACRLVTSSFAEEEARRNLEVKRPEGLATLEGFMQHVVLVPEASPALVGSLATLLPGKDRPILAAAIAAGADWLVTGDRQHFGALFGTSVEGVEIVPPTEALRRLVENTV